MGGTCLGSVGAQSDAPRRTRLLAVDGACLFRRIAAFAVYLAACQSTVEAAPCRSESFEGAQYAVCSFNPAETDIRIFWRNAAGRSYRTFSALACDNALYLDGGSAAGPYAPEFGRDDPPGHGGYGPIIGAVRAM